MKKIPALGYSTPARRAAAATPPPRSLPLRFGGSVSPGRSPPLLYGPNHFVRAWAKTRPNPGLGLASSSRLVTLPSPPLAASPADGPRLRPPSAGRRRRRTPATSKSLALSCVATPWWFRIGADWRSILTWN